jgi:hypothetical protein
LTVSDVWGPAQVEGPHGKHWMVLFTDGAKCWSMVYFTCKKSKATEKVKDYQALIKNQFSANLKILQINNGCKYLHDELCAYLAVKGIMLETTAPYSSHQNRIVEHLNWTLVKHTHMMLVAHNLPKFLWVWAVAYACYLKN